MHTKGRGSLEAGIMLTAVAAFMLVDGAHDG